MMNEPILPVLAAEKLAYESRFVRDFRARRWAHLSRAFAFAAQRKVRVGERIFGRRYISSRRAAALVADGDARQAVEDLGRRA